MLQKLAFLKKMLIFVTPVMLRINLDSTLDNFSSIQFNYQFC